MSRLGRRVAIALGVVLCLQTSLWAVTTEDTTDEPYRDYPRHLNYKATFKPGERLVYEIKWAGIPAGRAVFEVKNWIEEVEIGGERADCLLVTCTTRSNPFASFFYPVNDDIQSLIDVKGSFSRQFDMEKREGRLHARENIIFDYERRRAEYVRVKKGPYGDRTQAAAVRLIDKVQDPLSSLYYLRNLDLVVGESVKMTVNTAKRNWILRVNVLRKETLDLQPDFGKIKTFKVRPEMSFPGLFVRKGKMTVWLEETTGIPVKMTVDVPVGSVTVVLADAENAPWPFVKGDGAAAAPKDE